MQSKGSIEVHGDLLAAQCRQIDPIKPSAGKSPSCLDQSPTVPAEPSASALGVGVSSEFHPQAAKPATFPAPRPGPQSISGTSPDSVKPTTSITPTRQPSRNGAAKGSRSRGNSPENVPGSERFIRRREVQRLTGLSRSSLYRLIAEKDFPPAIRLSSNTVAWLESEVSTWIRERVEASRQSTVTGKSTKVGR